MADSKVNGKSHDQEEEDVSSTSGLFCSFLSLSLFYPIEASVLIVSIVPPCLTLIENFFLSPSFSFFLPFSPYHFCSIKGFY